MPLRPCLGVGDTPCGALSAQSRCPAHRAALQRVRDAQRGNSAQRGYGHSHRKRRAEMLPAAYGDVCARCGRTMHPGQALDAGHSEALVANPYSKSDRIEHARCNRSAGSHERRA